MQRRSIQSVALFERDTFARKSRKHCSAHSKFSENKRKMNRKTFNLTLFTLLLASCCVYRADAQCSDFFSFCGSLSTMCNGFLNGMRIRNICPQSCGLCQSTTPAPCVDSSPSCRLMTAYCSSTAITVLGKPIREYCPLSCYNCPSVTTVTPQTTTTTPRTTTTTWNMNACSTQPCSNGGTCFLIGTNPYYICYCLIGYSGRTISTSPDTDQVKMAPVFEFRTKLSSGVNQHHQHHHQHHRFVHECIQRMPYEPV